MRKRPRFVVAFIPKTFSALCTLQNQAFIVAARVVRNDNDNDGDDDGRERPSSPFVVVVEKVFEDFFVANKSLPKTFVPRRKSSQDFFCLRKFSQDFF